ncbi:MAG TPA: hydroxymethylbilane synthase [Methylomirabilota bacterium]|nr:hydroxymethylbilane synthase [Methylomirabilota bacterium]
MKPLAIGSRGSALALWQAEHVRKLLRECAGISAEVIVIKTSGDKLNELPFGQVGLKGMFIKELEDALLDGRVDLAVHSLKDVPSVLPDALTLAAICEREDVRDALLSRSGQTLDHLPRGARIGTSSLRRLSQLRHYRPDLRMRELRGNLDTRLAKLERGECDAIVLAKAGLDRLGLSGRISQVLPPNISLPAAGQGALAIEVRAGDRELADSLGALDHEATRRSVAAERALSAALGGGCQVPIGAWARIEGEPPNDVLRLDAAVLSPDGTQCLRQSATRARDEAEALGRQVAASLRAAGAERILGEVHARLSGRANVKAEP